MCELELFQSALFLLWLSSQCSGIPVLELLVVFSIGCVEKYSLSVFKDGNVPYFAVETFLVVWIVSSEVPTLSVMVVVLSVVVEGTDASNVGVGILLSTVVSTVTTGDASDAVDCCEISFLLVVISMEGLEVSVVKTVPSNTNSSEIKDFSTCNFWCH